jgi:hypothetical protein
MKTARDDPEISCGVSTAADACHAVTDIAKDYFDGRT